MARRPQVREFVDWSGGLNYSDDAFTLAENQVVDCLNVRLLPRGGFERRKTAAVTHEEPFVDARNMWVYNGVEPPQIIVQDGDSIQVTDDLLTFAGYTPASGSTSGVMRAATLARQVTTTDAARGDERCYVQRNAEAQAFRWNGTSITLMTDAYIGWNENLEVPLGGKMPKAKFICAHQGFLFHANIYENSKQMVNRVRFSHPSEPEDYRQDDWFDVGGDGEPITGIVSFGPTLYIFKNSSVWAFNGYSADTFQLMRMSDALGAPGQDAIVAAPNGLYFFDAHDGVYVIGSDGQIRWLWGNLSTLIKDSQIPGTYVSKVSLAWMDQRLWVSVPWLDADINKRVFVFDPLLGQGGGWYQYAYANADDDYGFGISTMLEFRPAQGQIRYVGLGSSGTYAYFLEYERGDYDVRGENGGVRFSSFLQTAWYRVGLAGAKKRFRRPRFVLDATRDSTIGVIVYRDYDRERRATQMHLNVSGAFDGGIWDAFVWSSGPSDATGGKWGSSSKGDQVIVRGQAMGSAYAVSFRFEGEQRLSPDVFVTQGGDSLESESDDLLVVATNVPSGAASPMWGVNAIDLIFLPRAVR